MRTGDHHALPEAAGISTPHDNLGTQEQRKSAPSYPRFWDDAPEPNVDIPEHDDPPLQLTPPPGLVGVIASYIHSSSRYPMSEGALVAALGLTAGIAGRCYNFGGTGLNLYLLLLAPTGRGKEAMAQGINRLLAAVRPYVPMVDECMGPAMFASGQGLLKTLAKQPCFLSIQGEFGLTLKNLNDPRATSSDRMLKQVMLDVYGKSGRFDALRPRSYADDGKDIPLVEAPCVSILGESTPGHVFDSLSFRDVEDGLLPRSLVLECIGERPRQNSNAGHAPQSELVNALASLAAVSIAMRNNKSYCEVQASPGAAALLQQLTDRLDILYNDDSVPEAERALWNRAGLNVRRIAALIAIGIDHNAPVIDETHARWAIDFVEICVSRLAKKFRSGIVGTGEVRQEGEVRKYITEYVLMKPEKKRKTYKVPQKLCNATGCIGVDYLRRRARSCTAFTEDRRGLNMALESALLALCKSGFLAKLTPLEASSKFGLRGDIYALSSG